MLLGRRAFHLPLIEAIETDQLSLGELNLDLEQRRLLMRYSSAEVKARASRLLGDEEYSNRRTHLDQRVASMPSHGRAQAGLEVFKQHCASCHRSGAMGYEVGPDLSDMSHRSVEDLAYNILDPNMAINPSYIAYEAETLDGELITGIPSAQSSSSVTLLMAQGVQRELPRKQLAEFRSGGLSLMPEGSRSSSVQRSSEISLPSFKHHADPEPVTLVSLDGGSPSHGKCSKVEEKKKEASDIGHGGQKDARSESRIHT